MSNKTTSTTAEAIGEQLSLPIDIEETASPDYGGPLNTLSAEAYKIAVEHGWHEEERTFGDYAALIHSEVSEALEDFRNGRGIEEIYYEGNKPCGIPIEFADVIIRIFDVAAKYDIDLDEAVALKMLYNRSRPYRHGNKAI